MTTDTQAIRERAERLIKLARKTNHGHPLAQQNFDDACFLEVPTICRDLLSALDREKALGAEVEGWKLRYEKRNSEALEYYQFGSRMDAARCLFLNRARDAEAQLATLRQFGDAIGKIIGFAGTEITDDLITLRIQPSDWKTLIDIRSKTRAAFPASAPKGEK